MLECISGFMAGVILGFIVKTFQGDKECKRLANVNNDLMKYVMAKQDMGAYVSTHKVDAFGDRIKQEEESKNLKEQLEFNAIYLRDSVNNGMTEKEMKKYGILPEEITA